MVSIKGFRDDPYYRLNIVPIRVPQLRDRKEGIRLLVDAFLEKHGADAKCWDRTAKFMDEVMAYGWVGNIRELESVVQRIIALPDLTHLDFRHSGVDVASILGLPTV